MSLHLVASFVSFLAMQHLSTFETRVSKNRMFTKRTRSADWLIATVYSRVHALFLVATIALLIAFHQSVAAERTFSIGEAVPFESAFNYDVDDLKKSQTSALL